VEVTFDMDANGILSVTAKDKASGKEQKVTITASTNLNKNDVERMVREAEAHKAEDEKRKALIEARNLGDSAAYQAEKAIKDLGDKVDQVNKGLAESKIKALRDAVAGEDMNAIQSATKALEEVMQMIGQSVHQQASASGEPNPSAPGDKPAGDHGDDFVEGEFHEA
jgi:molecular chaperone DnaK